MPRQRRSTPQAYLSAAIVMVFVGSITAARARADEVTPLWTEHWDPGEVVTYAWGVSQEDPPEPVPEWLKPVIENVLLNAWVDRSRNNSNGPTFSYLGTGTPDVRIRWSPDNGQTDFCDASGSAWIGCANTEVTPMTIFIRKDPQNVGSLKKWCHYQVQLDCPDEGRATIHEVGHIGGLGHNVLGQGETRVWAESRMTSPDYPENAKNTWDVRTLGRCDEAALQMRYDLYDKADEYSECLDHIANAIQGVGLETELTASPASYVACAFETVTVSGHLKVHDYGSYDELANNGLWSRTVSIDRGGTANYTSATTGSGSSAGDWSKGFTHSNITFNYVAHYDAPSGEGLSDSPNRGFSITWLSPQVPCG